MAEPIKLPKGTVSKQEFLEAVRDGLYNAMRERDRVPAVAALLPCFDCRHGAKAVEEVVGAYVALLHGERPPREDDRPLPYLPRTCCRQAKLNANDQANDSRPADAIAAKTPA
jgi:hypothetical protein